MHVVCLAFRDLNNSPFAFKLYSYEKATTMPRLFSILAGDDPNVSTVLTW
jgi:hypothetical protein